MYKTSHNSNELEKATMESVLSLVKDPMFGSQDFLRAALGSLLGMVAKAERSHFLGQNQEDKANGFYSRSLSLGSLPLEINVPRVRSGQFRPAVLPALYLRGYPETSQALLLNLLASSRSQAAAKSALAQLGLPLSEQDLEQVVGEVLEDFKLLNSKPIGADLLALFMDAKLVEVRDGNQLKTTTIYLVVGLERSGLKRVLVCLPEEGRESLENWKKIIRSLLERGLRRPLIIVQDDFSGLANLIKGLFPRSHLQLCTVHMLRNAVHHMNREDAKNFSAQFKTIAHSWNWERAKTEFDELCGRWQDQYPTFIEHLAKKRDLYLAFLAFPKPLRKTLSTTNAVEVINRIFEKIRLNNSGYFQSLRDLQIKLGLSIQSLHEGRWSSPAANVKEALQEMNLMFDKHFEEEK
jgi:transposase-like protein